jgi:hypothetical protein
MEEVLIKVAPTVYDILEATIRAAIEFTEADAGHIFLIKHLEDQVLVSHQCLLTDTGAIIRQYEEDRPFMYGPCHRSIDEGKMYYVHDAKTNPLHQLLLAELGRIKQQGPEGQPQAKIPGGLLRFSLQGQELHQCAHQKPRRCAHRGRSPCIATPLKTTSEP